MPHIINQYTQYLLSFTEKKGVYVEDVCQALGTRIDFKQLGTPEAETTFIELGYFLKLANLLAGKCSDPLFFLKFGRFLDISCHGFLGYAAKSAHTVREAILIDCELIHTRISGFDLELVQLDTQYSAVRFNPTDLDPDDGSSVFDILAGSLSTISLQLPHSRVPFLQVNSSYCAKTDTIEYEHVTQCEWNFERDHSEFIIPNSLLSSTMPDEDPALKQLAKNECEKLLKSLPQNKAYAVMVSKILKSTLDDPRSLKEIADCLYVSTRTLKRKLKEEGTSFTELHKQIRQSEAQQLLTRTGKSIEQIAFDLGFSSGANFISTYKRWTGESPAAYRKNKKTAK